MQKAKPDGATASDASVSSDGRWRKADGTAAENLSLDPGNGVTMEFVLIPKGSFIMGSSSGWGDADEKPPHKVNIKRPFYMGKFVVTQQQWEAVTGNNPSVWKGPKNPVDTVGWDGCKAFLQSLNERLPGYNFALPTEAQWEYACRAGTTTDYCYGNVDPLYLDKPPLLGECAWFGTEFTGRGSMPVGKKRPNPWGLYDMHGNVWEWCQDWYGPYSQNEETDAGGPSTGSAHVVRGGSYNSVAQECRSACRNHADQPRNNLGVRVVCCPTGLTDLQTPKPKVAMLAVLPGCALTTLASFDGGNGSYPVAGLVVNADGKIYGTTKNGGTGDKGTIFELDGATRSLTTLASFNGSNGSHPCAGLITDGGGDLYGITEGGGTNGDGTVFVLNSTARRLTQLATFDGSNGSHPLGSLANDASGNLYGTTKFGGASNNGTVFEIDSASHTITTIFVFDGPSGAEPCAGLTADGRGGFYGTAMRGEANDKGTFFRIDLHTHNLVHAALNGVGAMPIGGVVASHNIYGTTSEGGPSGDGTVFVLDASTGSFSTLAWFNGGNGRKPVGNLVVDPSDNLYGTTYEGGANGAGTVFKIDAKTHSLLTLVHFDGRNGANPAAGLVFDSGGNLYGTTSKGGPSGDGTVFELSLPH